MDVQANYERWLNSPRVSEEDKNTLRGMTQEQINDAFFKNAEFGTGGLRGVLGPGTNRVNVHTVGRISVGFAKYLLDKFGKKANQMGIAISHDNRYFSREFTLLAADIFNKMGIKVYIFDDLRSTPELSFAVRDNGCCGGIMITASHNPKNYNGYKVYDEKGCQLVPDLVEKMLKFIDALPDELSYEVPQAKEKGELVTLGEETDNRYYARVKEVQVHPELDKKDFRVVYSPQHGASYEGAMSVFSSLGYEIIPVKEQCVHDPNFGATLSPNPEVATAWDLPLAYARKYNAQLVVMTDPDGDRCGLAYRGKDRRYHRLTGNESAALLIDYILSEKKKAGVLPANPVMYDTIVSSSLGRKVAQSYGVSVESFLTGFKFIGSRIGYYEDQGKGPKFVFGYEESYGCLASDFVRDKDGIQAILLYTEMALFHYRQGRDLGEAYEELQQRFGYHLAIMKDMYFEGMEGNATMQRIMKSLHERPCPVIAGTPVAYVEDYLSDRRIFADKGKKEEKIVGLPASDVLKFFLNDGSTLCIRPSGTEPKVKFYIEVVGEKKGLAEKAEALYEGFLKDAGIN
ncbi:MAG: phospho-sugar mutase [Bacilli bacterium]|nr:phospho-sugar mutase [Bacilli bacterium]MBO6284814.1 phospho-sugar mutase [Bacilli bacterium]